MNELHNLATVVLVVSPTRRCMYSTCFFCLFIGFKGASTAKVSLRHRLFDFDLTSLRLSVLSMYDRV